MNYRFNDLAQLRQEIAIAAARMIAEEGTSYDAAKRKAARLLLGNSRITGEILPDNQTIENEVRIYNELFLSDTQPARLRHLRLLALRLMKRLERFNPYITGAVLNGTGGEHSDIYLQIFADNFSPERGYRVQCLRIATIARETPCHRSHSLSLAR